MKPAAAALALLFMLTSTMSVFANGGPTISIEPIGTYRVPGAAFDRGAAEIVAHDPRSQRLFVVNGFNAAIDVLDVADPTNPTFLFAISVTPYGAQANSVDVHRGIVAVAVQDFIKTQPGKVVFFDTDGEYIDDVVVGALPDMLTFTSDGKRVLVANEAEPNDDYSIDPPGSVSIIDIRRLGNRGDDDDCDDDDHRRGRHHRFEASATTVGFSGFNSSVLDPSIRIFGPNATVAQDLEPEYIAISDDGDTAYVTLQENNALGILDLRRKRFTRLVGLGFKNHNLTANKLDPSDRPSGNPNGVVSIGNWPVFGMYQPDGIASFSHRGRTYLITANEGDAREYTGTGGLVEEIRIGSGSYVLDPIVFPNATTLKDQLNLGRLNVTKSNGFQGDGDSEYERMFAFGARSFSIWNASGEQVYDSGDDIEQITAERYPLNFNAGNTNNTRDDRSDNKGPEPEGVAVAELCDRTYAFIALERIGGILVYDISRPDNPTFVQYVNNRDFTVDPQLPGAGDLGPEGVHFISKRDSPSDHPLLVVANEVSGTTTVYKIDVDGRCHGGGRND